jgi:hypothetical protein
MMDFRGVVRSTDAHIWFPLSSDTTMIAHLRFRSG